jgi:hypothetical protein
VLANNQSSDAGRDDLERLLRLAEQLRDKTEASLRRVELFRTLEFFLAGTAALAVAGASFVDLPFRQLSGGVGVVSGLYVVLLELFVSRLRRRVRPDRAALSEVVHLLREIESAVAEKRDWSPIERAEFRIRLSRFDIGNSERGPCGLS